jgi:hydroxyacylglutathione hydrolase
LLRRLLGTRKGASVPELTPREANERVVAGEAVLVDVREDSEWEAGRIPSSIHVPLSQIRSQGSKGLPEGKEAVLVCRSGARSAFAAAMLSDDALKTANLAGGVQVWVREGLPFEGIFVWFEGIFV